MKRRSDATDDWDNLRDRIIGLGEHSIHKSYYPELQSKLEELERFRELLDQSTDAIFLTKVPSGKISDVNRSACRQLGYSREQMLTMGIRDMVPIAHCHGIYRFFEDARKNGKRDGTFTTTLRKQEAQHIPVEMTVRIVEFGDAAYAVFVARDISQRMEADSALRDSEEKYRQLFEMESDAILLIERKTGQILEVNSACCALYGYSRDELLQHKNTDVSAEPEETRKATLSAQPTIPVRHIRRKDGTTLPVEMTTRAFTWQGQEVVVTAMRDIGFRIKAERDREQLERQLRQAQKMEAIGMLAGGIAHDFNNILYPIMGYAEILLKKSPDDKRFQQGLTEILSATNRAKELVKQILTFSRQTDMEPKPVIVQTIVKEALRLSRASLPTTIEIIKEIDEDCSMVLADPTHLHQIILNLITNAYHAMQDTGGKLTVRLTETKLRRESLSDPAMEPGAYVQLSVSDTGIGMEPATLDHIFAPYYTTKGKDKGTGLGLAVVHGIVKQHGGDIRVESEPGRGSTFHVCLPVLKTTTHTCESEPDAPIETGSEHILLVDDETMIVELASQMLEGLGYQVTVQTSSIGALEAFRFQPYKFDLVITDLTMPDMTGADLAQEMMGIRPDIPIILCTGFSELMSETEAEAIGIKGYLSKPISYIEMAAAIRKALDET